MLKDHEIEFLKTKFSNFDREHHKMQAWIHANKGRKLTLRFATNWLNRSEGTSDPSEAKKVAPKESSGEYVPIKTHYSYSDLDLKIKTYIDTKVKKCASGACPKPGLIGHGQFYCREHFLPRHQ